MRADLYILKNGFVGSRTMAQKLIEKRAVEIDGKLILKPSDDIADGEHDVSVKTIDEQKYVSRGGLKLEGALDAFSIDVKDKIAVDIGASTGGFTHCLLTRGIRYVFCVDSGTAQLHPTVANSDRVTSLEKTNARFMTCETLKNSDNTLNDFDGHVDIAVMDVSFISQTCLVPAISNVLSGGGMLVSLIKPQFEVGRAAVGKGGIVKSQKDRDAAVENVRTSLEAAGFVTVGIIPSPIEGGDGNREYIGCFIKKDI